MVNTVPVEDVPPVGVDAGTVAAAVVVFAVAYLAVRLVTYALTRVSEASVERRITVKMFVPLVKFVIYLAALYYVLGPVLDLSSTQILAFSGVLGAVLGLGIKDLFADIVGGLVIVLERPYRIGDMVELDDHYGEVTDIGIRSTELTTLDDDTVNVPNYLFFTKSVTNSNDGAPEMMVVTRFHLSPDADLDRAVEVVRDALRTSRYVYLSDDHGVDVRVEDSGGYVTLRGRAYVNDVRNEGAFRTDVTERVFDVFDDEGIEVADPSAFLRSDRRQE